MKHQRKEGVRARSLLEHVERMAEGGQAMVRRIQALAEQGLLDRAKILEHLYVYRLLGLCVSFVLNVNILVWSLLLIFFSKSKGGGYGGLNHLYQN